MAERSKAHAWKVCKRQKRFVGSNPTLSATSTLRIGRSTGVNQAPFVVALAAADLRWRDQPEAGVRAAGATFARYGAAGPAAAFPIGQRLAAPSAAAVNACAVHSIDFDDSYMAGA